jgi:PAS domain S-box-containing protein
MAITPKTPPTTSMDRDSLDIELLKRDHERFRQIAEINQTVIWEVNTDGLFTYVSPMSEKIFGYTPDELVGKLHFYDLHPSASRDQFRADCLKAFSSQHIFHEYHNSIKRKDGKIITVATNGVPFYSDSGAFAGYRGSDSDITALIKTESKLNESHQLLTKLTTQIPGVVYQYQLFPDGSSCFPYSSDGMKEIYGLSAEEVKADATEVFRRLHPDDVARVTEEIYESARNLSPFKSEYRVILPEQGVSWRLCFANPQKLSDGSVLWHGIISDVTERKLIEDELKFAFKQTSDLQKALDSVPVAVYIKDRDSKYTYANTITLDIFGTTLKSLKGKSDYDFFAKETANELIAIDQQVFKGKNTTKEVKTIDVHGNERYYLEIKTPIYDEVNSGEVIGLMGMSTDISSTKEAERKVYESEQYLRSVIKAIPDSLFVVDSDGLFLDFKADTKDLYIPDGSFLGQRISDVMPSDISEIIYSAIKEALSGSEVVERHYSLNIHNSVKHYSSRFVSSGEDKVVATVTDITQAVNNLNRIKSLLSAEEEQNKRLRNFTHIVSHNLRSHTANMEGLLYLMEDEFPEIFANQYIQLLKVSSGNLKDTIQHLNQVLDINLTGDKEWSTVRVSDRIDTEIQSIQQLAINAGITISNNVSKDVVIEVIPAYLDSILLNLLTNAIKYRSESRSPTLIIESTFVNGAIELRFVDNGLGIDLKRHGEKIFGMYKTFHTNPDSKGLGLFMVKNQVEAMGGVISVESEVNVGTTFIVRLPRKPDRS